MTPHSPRLPKNFFDDAQPFKIEDRYCKLIPLTKAQFAIVEVEDYANLVIHSWQARLHHSGTKHYAVRTIGKKRKESIFMHVQIGGLWRDHKNMHSLDNRRSNLRAATRSQNGANGKARNGRKYKGAYRHYTGGFEAVITVKSHRIRLGWFHSEIDAAKAYDDAARHHFGVFARTNFP